MCITGIRCPKSPDMRESLTGGPQDDLEMVVGVLVKYNY